MRSATDRIEKVTVLRAPRARVWSAIADPALARLKAMVEE